MCSCKIRVVFSPLQRDAVTAEIKDVEKTAHVRKKEEEDSVT